MHLFFLVTAIWIKLIYASFPPPSLSLTIYMYIYIYILVEIPSKSSLLGIHLRGLSRGRNILCPSNISMWHPTIQEGSSINSEENNRTFPLLKISTFEFKGSGCLPTRIWLLFFSSKKEKKITSIPSGFSWILRLLINNTYILMKA